MASKKRSPGGPNKSQFVRDQSPSLSAAEVVEKAKAKGIELTTAFVYSIRSQAKSKAKGAKPGPKPGRPPASAGGRVAGGGIDSLIRNIVREEIRRYFTER
jgi:hypothetical protein